MYLSEYKAGHSGDPVIGWNEELQLPFRKYDGQPPEPGLPLELPKFYARSCPAVARFPDGMEGPIQNMTWGDAETKVKRHTKPKGSGDLATFEHPETHHTLVIKQRVDRYLLLSLYEQSQWLVGFRLDLFGHIENQSEQLPSNDPRVKKAVQFMSEHVVQPYMMGLVSKSGINAYKNKALQDHGIDKGKTTAKVDFVICCCGYSGVFVLRQRSQIAKINPPLGLATV